MKGGGVEVGTFRSRDLGFGISVIIWHENPEMDIGPEHVLITGYQTTGSDGQDSLVEQVTLNFKRVGLVYTPQLDDGTGGPEVAGGWDIGGNLAWEP